MVRIRSNAEERLPNVNQRSGKGDDYGAILIVAFSV